jgi:hypothetical protein
MSENALYAPDLTTTEDLPSIFADDYYQHIDRVVWYNSNHCDRITNALEGQNAQK